MPAAAGSGHGWHASREWQAPELRRREPTSPRVPALQPARAHRHIRDARFLTQPAGFSSLPPSPRRARPLPRRLHAAGSGARAQAVRRAGGRRPGALPQAPVRGETRRHAEMRGSRPGGARGAPAGASPTPACRQTWVVGRQEGAGSRQMRLPAQALACPPHRGDGYVSADVTTWRPRPSPRTSTHRQRSSSTRPGSSYRSASWCWSGHRKWSCSPCRPNPRGPGSHGTGCTR
jgi:hypothetical protein